MRAESNRSDLASKSWKNSDEAFTSADENVFTLGDRCSYLCHLQQFSTSEQAPHNSPQIRSSHASCSGFINTDRRQVTSPLSPLAGPNQNCGNCTSARCRLRSAQAEKIDFASSDALSPLSAFTFQTTMSSSGPPSARHLNSPCPRKRRSSSSAASLPLASPSANSPSARSGSNLWVAQSATAAAPAREHSRLISP